METGGFQGVSKDKTYDTFSLDKPYYTKCKRFLMRQDRNTLNKNCVHCLQRSPIVDLARAYTLQLLFGIYSTNKVELNSVVDKLSCKSFYNLIAV